MNKALLTIMWTMQCYLIMANDALSSKVWTRPNLFQMTVLSVFLNNARVPGLASKNKVTGPFQSKIIQLRTILLQSTYPWVDIVRTYIDLTICFLGITVYKSFLYLHVNSLLKMHHSPKKFSSVNNTSSIYRPWWTFFEHASF